MVNDYGGKVAYEVGIFHYIVVFLIILSCGEG